MSEPSFEEPAPAPVFVDQSGLRGRLLRGFGWPVSVVGAILAVAMGSSLIGVQADAPAMGIPVQPSWPPAPSPTPSPSASSPRTAARSATPQTNASAGPAKTAGATPKPTAATPKTAIATSKTGATGPKTATTAPRGATPSGQPAKGR